MARGKGGKGGAERLTPEGLDALLRVLHPNPSPDLNAALSLSLSLSLTLTLTRRVLHHRNEELLVIFSNADLDHTSTIDKAEFALSLRSMGVRHVGTIMEVRARVRIRVRIRARASSWSASTPRARRAS